jgi:hypothetical protein
MSGVHDIPLYAVSIALPSLPNIFLSALFQDTLSQRSVINTEANQTQQKEKIKF